MKGKLGISILLIAMMLTLGACGRAKEEEAKVQQAEAVKEMTAQERYDAMNEASAKVNSMSAQILVDMGLTMGEEKLQTTTQMEMSSFTDPLKTKMIMSIDMGEMGSQSMETYIELTEDGVGTAYIYDGASWTKEEIPNLAEIQAQYEVNNSVGAYVNGITDLKEEGKETMDGKEVVKLSGVIKGEALRDSISETGSLDSLQGMMTEEQMLSIFEGLENESSLVELWLNADTNEMVKASVDMTNAMNKIYENMGVVLGMGEEFPMSVESLKVVIDEIKYTDIEDFTIPEEAKQ